MRRWNAILAMGILALFLLHGILGAFQIIGWGSTAMKAVGWADLILIGLHTLIGIKLTADTLLAQKRAGAAYPRQNALFWARRVSGLAVMLFLAFHLLAFSSWGSGGGYRLPWFSAGRLVSQILLVASIGVHVLCNVRPALLSFGAGSLRRWMVDILLVLSVLLAFMAAAFVVYYLRWNVW